MSESEYNLRNKFTLFYDTDKVIPLLDKMKPILGAKIKQIIWNKAFERSIVDFKQCEKGDHRFFIIKNPSIKISYRDFGNSWVVCAITPYSK